MRQSAAFFTLSVLLALCPARGWAKTSEKTQALPRLAVLLVSTGSLKASLGDDLTEGFISALSALGKYRITGKEEVKTTIGRGETGVVQCLQSPVCLSTVGTTLGVNRMAVGTLSKGAKTGHYSANLMLVDVSSGKILYSMKLKVPGGFRRCSRSWWTPRPS